jgi:hypothetical protein
METIPEVDENDMEAGGPLLKRALPPRQKKSFVERIGLRLWLVTAALLAAGLVAYLIYGIIGAVATL